MNCPVCGADLPSESIFCQYCGTNIIQAEKEAEIVKEPEKKLCPVCGADLLSGSIFCQCCGSDVTQTKFEPEVVKGSEKKVCPVCGADLPSESIFCQFCGTNIVQAKKEVEIIKEPEKKMCLKCGTELASDCLYCPKCGESVIAKKSPTNTHALPKNEQNTTNDIELQKRFFLAYITGSPNGVSTQSSLSHYEKVFNRLTTSTEKYGWNWAAFLVAPFWLLYRKLYGFGALVIFFNIAFTFAALSNNTTMNMWLPWVYMGMIGGIGDYLVYRRFQKKLAEVKQMYPQNTELQLQLLAISGGTNAAAVTVSVILYVVLVLFLLVAFVPYYF